MDTGKLVRALAQEYSGRTMLASFTDKSPFQVLIATVLSARTKDTTTADVVRRLFGKYPDAPSLGAALLRDIEGIIHRTGFYHVKAKRIIEIARIVSQNGMPKTMAGLCALPGVGRKTAACVMVYAYRKPAIPVDTHVHRISNRLGLVRTKSPAETEKALGAVVPRRLWKDINEVFVLHGQNTCTPQSPRCSTCIIRASCPRTGVGRSR